MVDGDNGSWPIWWSDERIYEHSPAVSCVRWWWKTLLAEGYKLSRMLRGLLPLPDYPVVCDSQVVSGRDREEWADASSSSFSPATARISLLICFLYELLYPVQSDHSWVDTIVLLRGRKISNCKVWNWYSWQPLYCKDHLKTAITIMKSWKSVRGGINF